MLPAYCSNPPDVSDAFGRELGERLTKEMYANPTLRLPILRALRNVVESQTHVQNQGEENESEKEERKENLRYLRGQAKNWLAVLFNVFASVERRERAQLGEVIGVVVRDGVLDVSDGVVGMRLVPVSPRRKTPRSVWE